MKWEKHKGLQVSETGIVRNGSNVMKATAKGYPLNDGKWIMPDELQTLLFSAHIEKVIEEHKPIITALKKVIESATLKDNSAKVATLKRGRKEGALIGEKHHKHIGSIYVGGKVYPSIFEAHKATGIREKTLSRFAKLGIWF